MADEYIRKQDAVNEINTNADDLEQNGGIPYAQGARAMAIVVERMPPVDVAPIRHSRWIKTEDGAECEKCGREAVYQIVDDHWEYEPFCPHCGAIMNNKRGNENG